MLNEALQRIKAAPARVVYLLFALALVVATAPAWRFVVLGFNPTLDDLLQLRCF